MVLPAHGAGSLCGAHLSDSPKSTIGAERTSNPYLALKSRTEFITAVLRDLPEAPQYFGHNAAMNRQGPPLVDWNAPLPAEVKAESGTDGHVQVLSGRHSRCPACTRPSTSPVR